MSGVTDKALRAERLLRDELFQEFLAETRAAQVAVFTNVTSDTAAIVSAHDIIVALDKIEHTLRSAMASEKIRATRDK